MEDMNMTIGRVKQGRAVVVGMGLDDANGHIRYTCGNSYELYGGSATAHNEMQRRMMKIQTEIDELGICLERLTYEQYKQIQAIVERINIE